MGQHARDVCQPGDGKLPVNEINVDHVLKVIKPIWHEKTDTAKRVRGRIETVLDFAKANKKREGENPARWDGNLKTCSRHRKKSRPSSITRRSTIIRRASSWRSCASAKASAHWR